MGRFTLTIVSSWQSNRGKIRKHVVLSHILKVLAERYVDSLLFCGSIEKKKVVPQGKLMLSWSFLDEFALPSGCRSILMGGPWGHCSRSTSCGRDTSSRSFYMATLSVTAHGDFVLQGINSGNMKSGLRWEDMGTMKITGGERMLPESNLNIVSEEAWTGR